jgi:hypothetical protein
MSQISGNLWRKFVDVPDFLSLEFVAEFVGV